jgi:DNA-binding NtrC family response regulator
VWGDSALQDAFQPLATSLDLRFASGADAFAETLDAFPADLTVVLDQGPETVRVLGRIRARHPSTRCALVVSRLDSGLLHCEEARLADWLLVQPVETRELAQLAAVPTPGVAVDPGRQAVLLVSLDGRDSPSIGDILRQHGLRFVVASAGPAALEYCERVPLTPVVILDLESPHVDWVSFVLQLYSRSRCEVLAIVPGEAPLRAREILRHHNSDFVVRPVNAGELLLRVQRLLRRWEARGHHPRSGTDRAVCLDTRSEAMRRLLERLDALSSANTTVLLRGETGTGKEVLARALHTAGPRGERPFFPVNCGAIPDALLESELFGHERGAFTGASSRKRGLVELAEGGTLFLDEVGELSAAMQLKILRLLQDREFMRLGGEQVIRGDVRVVAATHRNLEELVRQGRFREDLYYRIQVVPLHVPALRERIEDVPHLARFLLRRLAAEHGCATPEIEEGAMQKLLRHSWPGNIRELENVLERAVVFSRNGKIAALEFDTCPASRLEEAGPTSVEAKPPLQREYLLWLLVKSRGNVKAAAAAAGVDRRTIYRHLHALHLDPRPFRGERRTQPREPPAGPAASRATRAP